MNPLPTSILPCPPSSKMDAEQLQVTAPLSGFGDWCQTATQHPLPWSLQEGGGATTPAGCTWRNATRRRCCFTTLHASASLPQEGALPTASASVDCLCGRCHRFHQGFPTEVRLPCLHHVGRLQCMCCVISHLWPDLLLNMHMLCDRTNSQWVRLPIIACAHATCAACAEIAFKGGEQAKDGTFIWR